jgi:hypothetical protein
MDLTANGQVLTGTWTEETNPAGSYKGAAGRQADSACSTPLGSAQNQHGVRKRREITRRNRLILTRERIARLDDLTARSTRDGSEKSQVSGHYQPLSTCRAMTMRWTWLVPS